MTQAASRGQREWQQWELHTPPLGKEFVNWELGVKGGESDLYPPQCAASYQLRLGAERLCNELIIVSILGTIPAPATGQHQGTFRRRSQGTKGAFRTLFRMLFAHQMLLELFDDIVFLACHHDATTLIKEPIEKEREWERER